MFELIEIVVGLESIISWVEDVGLFFLDRLGGLIVALEPAPDLRHIDGGTTRCSPPRSERAASMSRISFDRRSAATANAPS